VCGTKTVSDGGVILRSQNKNELNNCNKKIEKKLGQPGLDTNIKEVEIKKTNSEQFLLLSSVMLKPTRS
jgi:hypothetical protein